MAGNTFGEVLTLTTFGESHGPGLGGIVDGCPSGVELDEAYIQDELDKRKPGGGVASTSRKELDTVEILSGVFEGKTTGTPIGFIVRNQDQRSRDYSEIKDVFRPGHADLTFERKFGFRDYRGGGRSSGRETVSRVAGGAVAKAILAQQGVKVLAYTVEYGSIPCEAADPEGAWDRPFFSPSDEAVPLWEDRVRSVKGQGDTIGGVVEIVARGVPAGWGEPVFNKLDARLAYALMGVGAVKAVEIGSGVQAARSLGSENNDSILPEGFGSNNSGGVLGGISSGADVVARAHVKPIPSIAKEQKTVDKWNRPTGISVGGRHDVSAIPRIVPVLKSMAMLVLADLYLTDLRLGRG